MIPLINTSASKYSIHFLRSELNLEICPEDATAHRNKVSLSGYSRAVTSVRITGKMWCRIMIALQNLHTFKFPIWSVEESNKKGETYKIPYFYRIAKMYPLFHVLMGLHENIEMRGKVGGR